MRRAKQNFVLGNFVVFVALYHPGIVRGSETDGVADDSWDARANFGEVRNLFAVDLRLIWALNEGLDPVTVNEFL